MKTGTRIFKNTLSLALGKGFGDLATFFFLIYFARVFGIAVFGQYMFAMSLGGFLSMLVNLGLNTLAVREISKNRNNDAKYIGNLLATQSVLALISWGFIGIFVLASNFELESKLIILIIGTYQILYTLNNLVQSRFQAHEDMEFGALLEISHKLLILGAGSFIIVQWENAVVTLLVYPVSACCMILAGIAISNHRYGKPEFRIDAAFTRELFSKAIPFFMLVVAFELYDRVGIVILTFFQGDEATGIFAASERFLVPLITGIGMFASALFPVMSRYARDSKEGLTTTFNRSIRIVMVTVLPTSTFLFLLNEQIIQIVYGAEFSESASVLRILSWVILPVGLSFVLGRMLVALDQQKKLALIQLAIYSGFLLACVVFIPRYSYIGLAYAKLVTSTILLLAYSWYLAKSIPQGALIASVKSPLIACSVTILAFTYMSDLNLWLNILFSFLICVAILFLTGGIRGHDLAFIKKSI